MIPMLIAVVAACVTYLITDYRRHDEFISIQANHQAELEKISDWAFRAGVQAGRIRDSSSPVSIHTLN